MSKTDTDDQDEMRVMVSARLEGELMKRYVEQAEDHGGSNKSEFLRLVIREGLTRMENKDDIETVIRETIRDELETNEDSTILPW